MRAHLLLSLSLFLAAPSWVQAQEKSTEEQSREKAKEAFKKAEAFYKTGDYEKALEGYKESYLLSQEPVLLYNMAQCYRLLGKSEDALRAYKNFLKDSPANAKFVKEAKKFVKDLEEVVKKQKAIEQANPTAVAPASEPTTKQAVPATTPAPPKSQPQVQAPEEPPKKAPPFLLGATGSFALAMGLGAFSLSKAQQSNDLAQVGDFEASASALSTARRAGLGADIFLGASLVSAGLACFSSADEGTGKLMVTGGVGGAALALALGGVSLRAAQEADQLATEGDFEASAKKLSTARVLGAATVGVGGLAVASSGVGLAMWDVEGEASPVPKYAALGSAVGALAAGALSLSLANQSEEQAQVGDFEASAKALSQAKALGLTADVLGVAAVASASAGALLARKAAPKNTTVAVSPGSGGASLSIRF